VTTSGTKQYNLASVYVIINANNNNLIYKTPYGRNFRGAGVMADRLTACRLKCLIKQLSLLPRFCTVHSHAVDVKVTTVCVWHSALAMVHIYLFSKWPVKGR